MEGLVKTLLEGSGIAVFVYFVIRGMRKEITALDKTVKHQNEIFDAMSKRISETEKMAESYKKWWEELQESYDKHKAALTKTKDEYITELEKAIEQKDGKLQAKAQAELDMITMQEETIEDLKRQAGETERQLIEMKERAKNISEIDQLTGVRSVISVQRDIIKLIRESKPFGVIIMDFDDFKAINDLFGHGVGDELLVEQAKRIVKVAGGNRAVGRLGGDEFLVVDRSGSTSESELFVKELMKEIHKPLIVDGNEIVISTCIGIGRFPEHGEGVRSLFAKAEMALYAAKREGKNRYKVCNNTSDIAH